MSKSKTPSAGSGIRSAPLRRTRAYPPALVLLLLFVISATLRFFISLNVSNGPVVYIDEGLYVNLARGLAFDHELTYRAMPTSYVYLSYPIALIPLLLVLPASVNLYRAIQLYNALLMASAIFPAYLFARRTKLDRRDAYLSALFLALLPDMALSAYLISEALLYPLFMWLAYFGWRAIERDVPPLGSLLACAALTALLYFTKPGYIVFGTVLLLLLLVRSLRSRSKRAILRTALGFAALVALLLAGYAIYHTTLDSEGTLLTHYDKQIPHFSVTNVIVAIQAMLLHVNAFQIAGLSFLLLFPFFGRKRFSPQKRLVLDATLLSLLVSIIGITVMVTLYEWRGTWLYDRLHLRYIMYYSPLLFMLLLSDEMTGMHLSGRQRAALFTAAVLTIAPGGYSGFNNSSSVSDSPSLALFFSRHLGVATAVIATACIVLFLLWLYGAVKKKGLTQSIRTRAIGGLFLYLFATNCAVYTIREKTQILGSVDIEPESQALSTMVDGETPLMVTLNHYDDFRTFQSDIHLHRSMQYVVYNNMLLDAISTGGVYQPFVPVLQAPNTENTMTVDTDMLVFDLTVADYFEFTDDVQLTTTPDGLYTIARITPGMPYIKTAIASMDAYTLYPGNDASLIVYDQELLERGSVTLHIQMRCSDESGMVTITADGQTFSIPISSTLSWYTVELPVTACEFFNISIVCGSNLIINSYYTE